MIESRLYSIAEFLSAEPAMGSEARVYELIRERLIPAVRIGRRVFVDPQAWEAFKANGGQALSGGWRREAPSAGVGGATYPERCTEARS